MGEQSDRAKVHQWAARAHDFQVPRLGPGSMTGP
jgi:hypothetical protein